MSFRSLLTVAVVGGAAVMSTAAFAQTYVAPGGSPVATAPGGSVVRPWAIDPDLLTTGALPDDVRAAAPAEPRAMRAPARTYR